VIELGIAVLVLAVAVVLLFAMYSELAARVSGETSATVETDVTQARLGVPVSWPAELDGISDVDEALVLVLSTTCASCEVVASQVRHLPARADALALIVASGDVAPATDYLNRHELHTYPCFVDVGGEWLRETLAVESSPVAIRVEGGIPQKAVGFGDLAAITTLFPAKKHRTEVEV